MSIIASPASRVAGDADIRSALRHRPATIEPAFGQIALPDADVEAALTNALPDLGVRSRLQHALPAVGSPPHMGGATSGRSTHSRTARPCNVRECQVQTHALSQLAPLFDQRVANGGIVIAPPRINIEKPIVNSRTGSSYAPHNLGAHAFITDGLISACAAMPNEPQHMLQSHVAIQYGGSDKGDFSACVHRAAPPLDHIVDDREIVASCLGRTTVTTRHPRFPSSVELMTLRQRLAGPKIGLSRNRFCLKLTQPRLGEFSIKCPLVSCDERLEHTDARRIPYRAPCSLRIDQLSVLRWAWWWRHFRLQFLQACTRHNSVGSVGEPLDERLELCLIICLFDELPRSFQFTSVWLRGGCRCCLCWCRSFTEIELPCQRRVLPGYLLSLGLLHHIVTHSNQNGAQIIIGRAHKLDQRTRKWRVASCAVKRHVARLG